MKQIVLLLLGICAVLTACSDTKKVAPKEGRIAVISEKELEKSSQKIRLNDSVSITQWAGPNANARNKIPAVSLSKATPSWKAKGASGRSKNGLPLPPPVVINNTVYTLDSDSVLMAHQVQDGTKIWRADSNLKGVGVGLTASPQLVVSVNEYGTVIAFDPKGKKIWQRELNTPFRNSPLLADGNLYLLSSGNDFLVLDVKTGNQKWHYKTNGSQTLLQGMGRPAVGDRVVVVPFSTGEVVAFDAQNGTLLWSQDLVGKKVFDAIASLPQMNASPVIEDGIVYLVGHGEQTMAVHLKTGESLWRLPRGGKTTPFVNGNALFFVDNQNHLLALDKATGRLFWETSLGQGTWKGPYLIDKNLVLFSDEKGILVNLKDGSFNDIKKRIEGSFPAITNKGIFFLGDNGHLYHWEKI
ncbi:MAG: PQQ-like beta-propeller repeat protein [Alphaproteobacteria bacterium]|nr:PQQ-like beta-propeller repeat protein [Alphaproteobacteria bacterium]